MMKIAQIQLNSDFETSFYGSLIDEFAYLAIESRWFSLQRSLRTEIIFHAIEERNGKIRRKTISWFSLEVQREKRREKQQR